MAGSHFWCAEFYFPLLKSNDSRGVQLENFLNQSQILASEAIIISQGTSIYSSRRQDLLLLLASEVLTLSHDIPTFINTLIKIIPDLQLQSFYLLFYDKFIPESKQVKLIFGLDERNLIDNSNNSNEEAFPSHLLIPKKLYPNRSFEWVVEALRSSEKQQFGFIVMESRNKTTHFGRISFQISAALQDNFLISEHNSLLVALGQSEAKYKCFFRMSPTRSM